MLTSPGIIQSHWSGPWAPPAPRSASNTLSHRSSRCITVFCLSTSTHAHTFCELHPVLQDPAQAPPPGSPSHPRGTLVCIGVPPACSPGSGGSLCCPLASVTLCSVVRGGSSRGRDCARPAFPVSVRVPGTSSVYVSVAAPFLGTG